MCVISVLCLIVVPLPPGKNPFAVKINNNNNNNNNKKQTETLCLQMQKTHILVRNTKVKSKPS
jgi:hypothetical protein